MNFLEIKEKINIFGPEKVDLDCDTSRLSSMGTGGKVAAVITADSRYGLISLLGLLDSNNIDYIILGSGTNTIFSDGILEMVIIKLGKSFDYCSFEIDGTILAGGACSTPDLIMKAARQGYDLSPLAGIPGTIGGAVSGNSGTGSWRICDHIVTIKSILKYNDKIVYDEVGPSRIEHDYRYFRLESLIAIMGIVLKVRRDKPENILSVIHGDISKRRSSQPVGARTSGCFFKNPPGAEKSAGAMIDECGLKGFSYGGAKVSFKHANFIENCGTATSEDVVVLSRIIKDRVKKNFGIELDYEVKLIGF